MPPMMKMPLRIGVTSGNALKIRAVREGYAACGYDVVVTGYGTQSGVGEQPLNDDTLLGARNRIADLREKGHEFDRIVSIESGIFNEPEGWIDRAVVVILDPKTEKETVILSEGVKFPAECVQIARERGFDTTTVGAVMVEEGYVTDAKDPHASLTGRPRSSYIHEALVKGIRHAEQPGRRKRALRARAARRPAGKREA